MNQKDEFTLYVLPMVTKHSPLKTLDVKLKNVALKRYPEMLRLAIESLSRMWK